MNAFSEIFDLIEIGFMILSLVGLLMAVAAGYFAWKLESYEPNRKNAIRVVIVGTIVTILSIMFWLILP